MIGIPLLFDSILLPGTLIRRYKRFIAEVALQDGRIVMAHCHNTGSMKGVLVPGGEVLLSRHTNRRRKLLYTWELARVHSVWAGVNTAIPNRIVEESIRNGEITELADVGKIRREVPYGNGSRIDLLLEKGQEKTYGEVKNVTLVENGRALFPDAVTKRGTKHLHELIRMVKDGHRAVMIFFVNREDGRIFCPAAMIDPAYAQTLREAHQAGVKILPLLAKATPEEILITGTLPYEL